MRVLLLLTVLKLSCIDVFSIMHSTDLLQAPMRTGRLVVERTGTQSSNRTNRFAEQVAVQSTDFTAELSLMQEQQTVHQRSKIKRPGASHSLPHRHVVDRGGVRASADHSFQQVPFTGLEPLPWVLCTVCACFIIVSGFLIPKRKSLLTIISPRQSSVSASQSDHCILEKPTDTEALSLWDGTVATFSCIVGTGLLAMPYAFSLAGMVAAPVVIFFVLCSAYTAHLMAWAFSTTIPKFDRPGGKPVIRGWGFLVEAAFGGRAKSAMNIFLIVELWGYLLSCIVCTSMNLHQIVEGLGTSGAICLSVVLAYALTFMPVRLLTQVSVASNMIFIVCCLMFLITGLLLPAKAPASDIHAVKPHGLILAAGILVFSPAAHSFYPALMQRMKEPEKFPMCLRRAYTAACVLYLTVAIPGYYLFGNATQPSAVQNIGADLHLRPLPDLGWMNTVAAVGMVVKMLALQPLVLSPLTSTIEGVLVGRLSDFALAMGAQQLVTPVVLIASAAVACRFANEMATLLNLIGSVFCMNVAFVMPVLCYWKLSGNPVGPIQKIFFVGLVLMGGTFAVLGVITAF